MVRPRLYCFGMGVDHTAENFILWFPHETAFFKNTVLMWYMEIDKYDLIFIFREYLRNILRFSDHQIFCCLSSTSLFSCFPPLNISDSRSCYGHLFHKPHLDWKFHSSGSSSPLQTHPGQSNAWAAGMRRFWPQYPPGKSCTAATAQTSEGRKSLSVLTFGSYSPPHLVISTSAHRELIIASLNHTAHEGLSKNMVSIKNTKGGFLWSFSTILFNCWLKY